MSQISLFERRQCVLGLETTYSVDPTLTGAANSMLTLNGSITYEADELERPIDEVELRAKPFVLVGKRATFQAEIELLGAATAGATAPISPALEVCGLAETLTEGPPARSRFSKISDGFESAALYFEHGGMLHKMLGIRGTIEWSFELPGYWRGQLTLTGFFTVPTAGTISGVTLAAFRAPTPAETETVEATINGVTVRLQSFSYNLGNNVVYDEDSEHRGVYIMDRKSEGGTIKIRQPPSADLSTFLGTLNPWTLATNHTAVPLVITLNGGTSRKVVQTVSAAQLMMPAIQNTKDAISWEIQYKSLGAMTLDFE